MLGLMAPLPPATRLPLIITLIGRSKLTNSGESQTVTFAACMSTLSPLATGFTSSVSGNVPRGGGQAAGLII